MGSDFENSTFLQILEVYPHSKIQTQSSDNVVLRVKLENSEEAEGFVKFFSSATHTNWIVSHTRPTQRLVFSKLWVCQHSKKNKKADSKRNVACESSLKIVIKKVNRNTIRNDSFLSLSPPLSAEITISLKHSHSTVSAEALRMLRVSDEVKDQFFEYFSKGMTPSDAIMFHENQFYVEEDYVKLANASINPTLRQVHYMHNYWRSLNLGSYSNPLEKLKEKLSIYESQGTDVRVLEKDSWVVAVVTPIMKRVQQLKQASEMVFIDSTCSVESVSSTLTLVLVATNVGALPVAVLIHPAQTTESYANAFGLLKEQFPLCFGGCNEPKIIMTDDSSAEKNALKNVWPGSTQLLCHFHVAQAEWRWIFSSTIPKEERPRLMKIFQCVMYATSEEELSASVRCLREEREKYPAFVGRFDKFFNRREEWVLFDRLHLLTRQNNTNNYAEASIRILKDIVLCRTKAFNVVALCEFCMSTWETYFQKKLLDFAHSRKGTGVLYSNLMKKTHEYKEEDIEEVATGIYVVKSYSGHGNKCYTVHADVGVCTCFSGQTGAFCKHQFILMEKKKIFLPNAPPVTPAEKQALAALALGSKCPPMSFFQTFEANDAADCMDWEAPQPSSPDLESREKSEESVVMSTSVEKEAIMKELERISNLVAQSNMTKKEAINLLRTINQIKCVNDLAKLRLLKPFTFRRNRINVQPTSIARRRPGLVRSGRRIPAGRPTAFLKRSVKSKRNLSESVLKNKPNAKSHGINH